AWPRRFGPPGRGPPRRRMGAPLQRPNWLIRHGRPGMPSFGGKSCRMPIQMRQTALAMSPPALAQNAAVPNPLAVTGDRNNAALGARLQGVQHFGLTVQNMDRAFEFYTEVLGGNEVMRDGEFHGEKR